MTKYRLIMVVVIASLLTGCGTVVPNVNSRLVTVQNKQQGQAGSRLVADSKGLQKGTLVPLTTSKGQDAISALVPVVLDGIDYAKQQGSLNAAQDLKTDGALAIDEKGHLTLLVFLKPNSLISYSAEDAHVKGDREVGFLWSCIQEKLQQAYKTSRVYTPDIINSFNIAYVNTKGDKLGIVMPGDDPQVTLNGQPVIYGDAATQDKLQAFFVTPY